MEKQLAMVKEDLKLVEKIVQTIFDKKGMNIIAIDVQGVSTTTDYFIVAEGSVDRHVKAIGQNVLDMMEEQGIKPIHVEGKANGDWLVLDFGFILVHLFTPELRNRYAIERLWSEGQIVDVKIEMSQD